MNPETHTNIIKIVLILIITIVILLRVFYHPKSVHDVKLA